MYKILVKMSGDLIGNEDVLNWLNLASKGGDLTIYSGGETDIGRVFKEMGYPIKFGPQGIICENFAQSFLAYHVLKNNKERLEGLLREKGIVATVEIPASFDGKVVTHRNGDDCLMEAEGYFQKYMLTLKSRRGKKKKQLKHHPEITVIGF